MKKSSLTAAVFCCMTVFSQHAWAQGELKDITTVTQKELKTTFLYYEDRMAVSPNPYQGQELHTGAVVTSIILEIHNEQDIQVKEPANPILEFSLSDPYGRVPYLFRNTEKICSAIRELKFYDFATAIFDYGHELPRGGQYVFRTNIPCLDYLYEKTVNIIDEPSVRIKYSEMKVGDDMQIKAFYNTGYPYDPSQFTGNETATMRLFALGKDEQGNPTETEVAMTQKTLRLHRPDQPLVAAIDALQLNYCDPEPGEYQLKMLSDWTHKNANRDNIFFVVKDTLRASAMMQKMNYVAGTDKELNIHMKMNYGYPFISTSEGDENPTVRIKIRVLMPDGNDGEAANKTLLEMTTPITEGVFSDRPFNWEGDMKTPALEKLEDAPLTETSMEAEVTVVFNGDEQFHTTIPFTYVPQSAPAGIRSIPNSESTAADTWYDLQGRPVETSTTKGIYIHSQQKVVVK